MPEFGRAAASSSFTTGPSLVGSSIGSCCGPRTQPSAIASVRPLASNTRPVTSADCSLASQVTIGAPRPDHDPALAADAGDLRDRILVALGQLPPKLRAVIVLRDVYELPHDAIAEELGISVTAAKVRLHRARHRLRSDVFPELAEVPGRAL